MHNNVTHLVVFELKKEKERKAVAEDYGLDKEKLAEISQLDEYECLFLTKEKMVVYTKDGQRKICKGKGNIWKGTIVPPPTKHIKASE